CLEKNAAERFHSAHDLGLALETLSSTSATAVSAVGIPPIQARARLWRWLVPVAAIVIATAAFIAGGKFARPAAVEAAKFQRLTFRQGEIHTARYAGDG